MRNLFVTVYHFFNRHKTLLFSVLTFSIVGILFFSLHLTTDENILNVLPQNEETSRVNAVYQNLNSSDKIIVKVSAEDTSKEIEPERLIEMADRFVESIDGEEDTSLISDILHQVDETQILDVMEFVWDNLPYFMTEEEYRELDTLLTREKIAGTIAEDKELLTSPMGSVYRQALLADPLHLSMPVLRQLGQFQVGSQYTTYDGYLFTKDKKALMLFITPRHPSGDTKHNELLIDKIDDKVNQAEKEFAGLRITYFGAAAVAVANARQIKQDSTYSIIIALALIILLLAFYFRNLRSLLLLLVPIAFGGGFALAAVYLCKGTISAIAIGTGSIIFGIAIDYSLHFLIHFREQPDVSRTIKEVSFPLLVGSTTTIAAFLSLIFLHSELLSDFGLFASFTLIGTILFVLVFLPHFLKEAPTALYRTKRSSVWNKVADYSIENNKFVVISVLLLTIVFCFFSKKVRFESDMHKINYMTEAQKSAFEELSHSSTLSQQLTYVASEGDNLEKALQNHEKAGRILDSLRREGVVGSISGIGNFFPSKQRQEERIARWNHFWKDRREFVCQTIAEESAKVGFAPAAFERFYETVGKDYLVREKEYFAPLRQSFLKEFLIDKDDMSAVVSMVYSSPENANAIRQCLKDDNDSFAFDATTLTQSMLSELQFDFDYLLWICGLVVILFLFLSFGSVEITLITFLPMTVAFLWILGIMGLFDIPFNIINIILATFIFGIGDDYSIFIMEGLIYEYAYGKKMLSTYKTAVILSAVTMFIGIGALIIAKHPAMFSLAQVTIIGMISVAIIAYVVAPSIFKWLTMCQGAKRKHPVTLPDLCKTIVAFSVFLFGSLVTTLAGFFLLTIGGKTEKHKLLFHKYLCYLLRTFARMMPQVDFHIRNAGGETFEKPGIIIANHQSHLDLLYLLALNPKIICLTNQWVWKSPFYGAIIRYADFYPVTNGIDNSLEKLRKAVNNGYSILVFPEGTRSQNCDILKFHQGAFHLAQKLNADIIPVLLHGVGHVFPKPEFILRKGKVTVQIMNRIRPDDKIFTDSKGELEVAKKMRRYYRDAFENLRNDIENTDYFVNWLKDNYRYKGKSIAKTAKNTLKENGNFAEAIRQLSNDGEIEIRDFGQGEFAIMASLVKRNLKITAIMEDEERLLLAKNSALIGENLTFRLKND